MLGTARQLDVPCKDLLPSKEGETSDVPDEGVGDRLAKGVGDRPTESFVDGPNEDRNRTSNVNEECDEALIGESTKRADCGSDDLRGLDGSDCEEDEGRKLRKFIKTRKAIKAHVVKHRRSIKFKKNDKNKIRAVCNDKGCRFVDSKMIAEKYVGQCRENHEWNFTGMSQ
ncbi:hypothetical protein QYF36_019536 [Acer negundo]|nr:hypothetical protein QYF36_019536 [Acer negundo]